MKNYWENGALRAKYKVNNLDLILTNEYLIINKCPQWGWWKVNRFGIINIDSTQIRLPDPISRGLD